MNLRLEFADVDGTPGQEFSLAVRDDQYPLPHLVLTADAPAWVEDADLTSCEVLSGDESLGDALVTAWRSGGPSGHGRQLSSVQCWLPAGRVTEPAEVRVTWLVTWYDTGPHERFLNSAEPFKSEGSVTLNFEPGPEGGDDPGSQRPSRHHGHVAVDFGTSNCTAALFDQQYLSPAHPLSPRQVSKLRADVLDLLDHVPAAGPAAQAEFGEFVADIAAAILPDAAGDHDDELRAELRLALAEDIDREPRLLYALLLELEKCVGQCSEELRPPLAAALNDAYNQSWGIPPLDQLRLFEVLLDVNEEYVIESKVTATVDPRLSVRVGKLALGDEGGQEALVYAGLKQRLASVEQHRELGSGVTSDDLIKESLRDIVRRCNTFIAQGPRELGKGEVNNVVITFPTMATPTVRQKLRAMVEDIDVPLVDNSFDEAIAAAMFVLLRDFGGDYDTGLELLRSRSRQVGEVQWKQNLLVIDIGGGTTDIALLGLHLEDETPPGLGAPGTHGRYYVLRPEILGSTGRLQLGGEFLSLRVFYWIKALLADQLLRLFPGSYESSLAALRQVLRDNIGDSPLRNLTRAEPSAGGGAENVLGILDGIVPTRAPSGYGRPTQAFWLLWSTADDVKLRFCADDAPEEITLRATDVRRLLRAAEWPSTMTSIPDVRSAADDDLAITLTKTEFERLVTADIDQIMYLAYRMAGERFAGTDERVDRIVLTGQASQAPLVRSRLMAVFSEPAHDGLAVSWQPSAVSSVQGDFAKLATSLGACWAKSSQDLVPLPKGAIPGLIRGRNAFRIVVDNLFFNLPCTFRISQQLGGQHDPPVILHIGEEMFQAYPDHDIAVIRSDPFELTGIVAIYRDGQGDLPRWGDFQWRVMAKELNLALDTSVWPSGITAQLEVTSSLDLFLLLSRGPAHYQVGGQAISVLAGVAAEGGPAVGAGFDPARIVVNAFWGDSSYEGTPVFRARGTDEGQDQPPEDPAFPEVFHVTGAGNTQTELCGAISAPLPEPSAGGSWTFHYLDGQNGMYHIGELRPPARTGQLEIRYFASVDERGDLRVHAGDVPYWPAYSLAEVQERPGSVFRAPMESTYTDYDPSRDPYNGQH
jgi:hypothetical protein